MAVWCSGLVKRFGAVHAVDQVQLSLRRGRLLALLGPSGCGKTTTLRLIAGLEAPDEGSIVVEGRQVVGPSVFVPPERRRIGLVFQDYALFPHLTVAQNVAYGLQRRGDAAHRISELLDLVGLSRLEARYPHELSGGQQQRVALARALAPEPAVILFDEPFSNLDAALRGRVRTEVRQILAAAGATAIFVTHDQEEALSLADEVAVMWRGRIVQSASPEELYWHPATRDIAAFVGEANFLPGQATRGTVVCELGVFPGPTGVSGDVEVMCRPETIGIGAVPHLPPPSPLTDPAQERRPGSGVGPAFLSGSVDGEGRGNGEGGAGSGVIQTREFYGHDQMLTVRLDSGTTLRVRLGPEPGYLPGRRVGLTIRGTPLVYPA